MMMTFRSINAKQDGAGLPDVPYSRPTGLEFAKDAHGSQVMDKQETLLQTRRLLMVFPSDSNPQTQNRLALIATHVMLVTFRPPLLENSFRSPPARMKRLNSTKIWCMILGKATLTSIFRPSSVPLPPRGTNGAVKVIFAAPSFAPGAPNSGPHKICLAHPPLIPFRRLF